MVFTAVAVGVTILFRADVEAQGGAYATGVLVLICSAAVAVTLEVRSRGKPRLVWMFTAITAVFVYTTAVNIIERPDGIRIASFFIVAIVIDVAGVPRGALDRTAGRGGGAGSQRRAPGPKGGPQGNGPHHRQPPDERTSREYLRKEREEREASNIPRGDPVLFLEVTVGDASEFCNDTPWCMAR